MSSGLTRWKLEANSAITTDPSGEWIKAAEVEAVVKEAKEAIQHLLNYAESIEAPFRAAFAEEYRAPLAIPNATRLLARLKEPPC
jgi:hypothetical protein